MLTIFDFDDTLFNTTTALLNAYKDSICVITGKDVLTEEIWNVNLGGSYKDICKACGITDPKIMQEIHSWKYKIYPNGYFHMIEPNYFLLHAAQLEFKNPKSRNVICTNSSRLVVRKILKYFKCEHYFHEVFDYTSVNNKKPSPDIFDLAYNTFKEYGKDRTIIYEDSRIGLEAANRFAKKVYKNKEIIGIFEV